MFEYNGTQFSLEQVEEAALAKGLSVDEYVNEYGITKKDDTLEEVKTEAVVEDEIAPAAAETVVTESQSDLGSSESQPNTVEEDFDIESIKFQFDKGNFEMDQRKAYEKYKSTGEIDESLLGEKTKIAVNEKGEKLSSLEAFKNAIIENVPTLFDMSIENFNALKYQTIEETGKIGVNNLGFGIGANVLDTPKQVKLKKEQATKINNAFDKEKIEIFNELQKLRKNLKTTGQGFVEGAKQGDVASMVGGAANGFASVLTSAIPAMIGGAAGTVVGGPIAGTIATVGTIFSTQLAPQFYVDFNVENAKALYPNLPEEEAIAKMFKENKEQVATPMLLAGAASGLETIGVKGLSGALTGKLASKGAKNYAKAMLAGFGKNGLLAKASKAAPGTVGASAETITEIFQLPLELINQAEAKKLKGDEYTDYISENFWDQVPEVIAQSFIGSRLFITGGSQLRKAARIIRDHAPVHTQGTASNSLFSLGVLKQRQALTKDPDVKQGMQDAINVVESQLKTELRRGNKLARKLSDKDIDTVIKANDEITNAQEQIENLEEQKEFGLDNTDYQMSRDGFQLKIKQADQKISEILTRVADESTQNIRNKDGSFTEEYKKELEKIRLSIIKPATSKVTNQEKLNNDLIDLQAKLDEGLISENQYEADFTRLTSEYAAKNNDIKNKVFKVNESVESVKESSIQASKDLQQAFDDGVTEGTITKDKDGKNVISDKAFKAIIKTQKPFIKKLSNQVYNAIPQDLRRGTKAEYESNLETELLDVLRTYNRSIPLGAYVQGILRKRAVSARALEGISNQTFNKDLESNAVQSIIAEEDSEVAPEIKNINTAKALNISNDLLTTIKNVAKRSLLTTQQKVDATKFKSDIAKTFKDALYTDIKQKLGLKDTKTNKGLTNAIEENPSAFYDAMSVEAMRKARGKGGINPFVEAGFLKDVNGVLEKVSLNKLGVDGILNYITDPNIAKNTRSDRQMHLVEALAVSMGAREAINLLENDTEFRQRFAEQQQQEQQTEEFKKAAVDVSVNKQKQSYINLVGKKAYDLLKYISTSLKAKNIGQVLNALDIDYIGINNKSRVKIQSQVLNAIKNGNIPSWVFESAMFGVGGAVNSTVTVDDFIGKIDGINFESKDGNVRFKSKNGKFKPLRRYSLADGGTILNNDPRFFLGTKVNGVMQPGMTGLVPSKNKLYYGKSDPAYIAALEAATENNKNNKDFSNYKTIKLPKGKDGSGTVVTEEFLNTIPQGSKISRKEQSAYNMNALEEMTKILNKAVNENGVDIATIARFITGSFQATDGLIKAAAPFKIRSKKFEYGRVQDGASKDQAGLEPNKKLKYREEHSPPASRIAASIIFGISTNSIDSMFPSIRKNFFQTQLSKKDDVLIDNNKLSSFLPNGMTIFDENVGIERLIQSKINLSSLIDIESKESLDKKYKVEGPDTIDGKKASSDAFTANNSDQVENLIDRAIAKLTELTGTEGTLQTNLGAVPVNILIGGLRATKLAYQGGKALADAIADGYSKVKDYMSSQEWSDFVSNSSQEVRNENNPAQVKLMIMNEAGVAKLQEQVRQGNYGLLKEFGIDIDGLTTDEIIEKIDILRKAKVVGSNTKAPKKKARVFDFDDTLAKTNSKVLYTLPDTTTQELTGTGDAFAIRTIIYNEVLNAISKNPNIERLRFSSDAREPSRVKLYDFITKKLSKDLGWKIDNYETSFLGKPSTQDFELVRPKNGGKKIKTKGKYNLTEDEAGNLNTNFVINGKTYDVNINNKDGENKADFEVEFSLNIPGETGSLDATQFAEQYNELQEAGATFDYSEFNQVKDGSKGPLATLAKRFTESKGDRDVFVLTARPAEAAEAIQEFLRSTLGISIPLQNISGLANGKPGAKAMWVAEKVSEGYNDVFFADDSKANVDAVARMLDNLGVTKRVQQAKESGQRNLEDEMDSLIRGKKRSKIGKFLSRFNIYIPPGADDFAGLLKYFQAKGKLGDEQMKWFEENLLTPFAQGINAYTTAKVTLANDFKALNKRFKNTRTLGIPTKFRRMLSENVLGGIYTNEQAVRAYLYDKAGQDLGLNKADTQDLIALVEGNSELKAYAEELSKITKLDAGYPPITEQWLGGSISTDMAVVSNRAQRAEFLQEFTNNKNQIFSDQNMKLIKQIYGNDYTDALSNILERMETGQNRKKGKDKEFNSAMNWINQSVGAVMAINMRSAILQQMSIVNYMNWSFNNPIKMGIAMANVPQFMKDYIRIINSDFLKERRGGMAIEVNLADIADSNPGNLFLRLNKKVLEAGFKPTQWGDSNAIAFGGATWYRNRYNQLIKEGMSESDADAQAMLEFQEVSETAQQSSRVDKVSRQQASDIGRLILAFANTPLQYARETRKATSDLVNRRGDWKTNISKILYYGVAQNVIFTALQQGLFSLILSDADDEEYKETDKKLMYSLNSVADGILRGMGYAGAVVAALKNLSMEYYDQRQKREKGKRVYDGTLKLVQKGLSISPPISKKISDIVEGQKFETWKQYKNDPFYQGFAYANYFSGLTNLPADRVFKKIENLKAASQDSTEAWQSVALALGWSPYNVGVDIEYKNSKASEPKKIKKLKSIKKPKSPVPDKLPEGVLGRANKDGTMDIKPGLSAKKRKEVVAHEQVHLDQFKSGKLDYTDSDITWKGQKIPRTADSKILYNGKLYIEGAKQLPWEQEANKLSKQKLS